MCCVLQSAIEARYTELQALSARRRHNLVEMGQLFEFMREADEVAAWIKEKEAVAASDDYGTDLEHVEVRTPTTTTLGIRIMR